MVSPRSEAVPCVVPAPHIFPLSESHALVVEVLAVLGAVRDSACVQHCLYLAQEFKLLGRQRYWFATDGTAAGLPYSRILEGDIQTLIAWGIVESSAGRPPHLRLRVERSAVLPGGAVTAVSSLAELAHLGAEHLALFAAAVLRLSRRGHHPTHERFAAALRAALSSHEEQGHIDEALTERIVALSLRLRAPTLHGTLPACAS